MRFLLQLLVWWKGQTIGTRIFTWRKGKLVGEDDTGNRYYQNKDSSRRWVIFHDEVEATKVPSEWHGWLHHTFDNNPCDNPLAHKSWELPHRENLSATADAYHPTGSIKRGGKASQPSDYEAWEPS